MSPNFGLEKEWDSQEEDGFDPYWGIIDEATYSQSDVQENAAFLLAQLAPQQGRHAAKSGFLKGLAAAAGIPLESVSRSGVQSVPLRKIINL